jgi:hypothetical protein
VLVLAMTAATDNLRAWSCPLRAARTGHGDSTTIGDEAPQL